MRVSAGRPGNGRPILVALAWLAVVVPGTADAQWIYRNPDVPRTATGTLDVNAPAPRTPTGTIDLSGVWQTDIKFNANLAADLPAGAVPMLPAGRRLYDERQQNLGKDDPEGHCMLPGVPRVNGVPFPVKIVQLPALVVMLYETRTIFRQVFLDQAHTLPKDPQPTWMGYSTGRWDGDTLVVETTGFNGRTWLDDAGHPASDALRVTERYRRVSFGRMFVDVTVDDPKSYSKPWSVTQEFTFDADTELIEYACNENNIDVPHLVGK